MACRRGRIVSLHGMSEFAPTAGRYGSPRAQRRRSACRYRSPIRSDRGHARPRAGSRTGERPVTRQRFLLRLRTSPLGAKLAILSAAMTVIVVSVVFLGLRNRLDAEVRRVFTEELSASQRGLGKLQDQNLKLLLETSELVSTSPTLRAAMQTLRV